VISRILQGCWRQASKKLKKVSALDLVPALRAQKQPKKTFHKIRQNVLYTSLKNKNILSLVAGTGYSGIL
jgi:hypothetical protein